jgi:O-antigen/teichoic acid export membrane protein
MEKSNNIINSHKFLVLIDQVLYSGSNFALMLWLARALSVSNFGMYSFITLGSYLLISISGAFIIQPFQVVVADFRNSKKYFCFLFYFQLFLLLAILLVGIVIGGFFVKIDSLFLSIAMMVFLSVFGDYLRKFFLAKGDVKTALLLNILLVVTQLIIVIYIEFTGHYPIEFIFFLIGLSYTVLLVVSVFILKPRFSFNIIKSEYVDYHLSQGRWLFLVALTQWLSSNLFVLMSGIFISIEALGAFRIVQSMFGVLNILFQTFENYVLPNASRIYIQSVEKSKKYIKSITLQAGLLIAFVLVVLFVFSNYIIVFVAGEDYSLYGYLIKGMCVLYAVVFLGYPSRLYIRILLLNKSFFFGYLISFIFSVLLSHFLLSKWQLNGVIVGLVINQLILLIYWNYKLSKNGFYLWK